MSGALGAQEITAALTACASEIGAPPGDLEKLGDLITNTMQLQTVPAFLADHNKEDTQDAMVECNLSKLLYGKFLSTLK